MNNLFRAKRKRSIGALLLSILIAEGVGALSGFLGMSSMGFYQKLKQPSFAPPGWVFPIVWSILYLLMGIAAYRIWIRGREGEDVRRALTLYAIQLLLNFLWTIIFFRFRMYGIAFYELLVLLFFIIITTIEFAKKDKLASALMIPYIFWVAFAGVLNYAIWILNK